MRPADAEVYIASTCFKTGPPRRVGVELEWLVYDVADPTQPVGVRRVLEAVNGLDPLPGGGRLSVEPGGQLEISSAPHDGLSACVPTVTAELELIRAALAAAGLRPHGEGVDPHRSQRRTLRHPRYDAMEGYFDRGGPDGRAMMCSTASVQVCLDAGLEDLGPLGFRERWRLLHELGPVFVAAFAASPRRAGTPTGWASTRQRLWLGLDPGRTRSPALDGDPRAAWAAYAMDAQVLCVPGHDGEWRAPPGLTLRGWLAGAGPRAATRFDVDYHLSTLFPPVRPRGWLELRMIDAQPGDDWAVVTAVVTALLDDPTAAAEAAHAASRLAGRGDDLWRVAARAGLGDAGLARVARACLASALDALPRLGADAALLDRVTGWADRHTFRGLSPADHLLAASKETVPC